MRRLCLFAVLSLTACSPPPVIAWPAGPVPATPALLPASDLVPPVASTDPGPGLAARATALRASLGM
jgi:hypothetical protein